MESWVQRWQPRTNAFCDFLLHLSKVLRLPRKIDARSHEVLHLSRKIISANLKIWYSKMQPLSGNERPDLRTSDEHVFCTAPATRNASLKILFKCPTPAIVSGNVPKPSRFAHFWQGAQSFAPATRNDIWTSKSGANMWCFVHFHFEMCFAPQRRALFRHLNCQKWSETQVFCTFSLQNLLRARTACTFSTSQLPNVVREWCALYILTSKCASRHDSVHFFDISTAKSGPDPGVLYLFTSKSASRHNGVQLFISHLPRCLRTRRFSEPTFSTLRSHKTSKQGGGPENPKAKRQQTNLSNTDNWFISFSPLASFFLEDEHYGRIHCKFHFSPPARWGLLDFIRVVLLG